MMIRCIPRFINSPTVLNIPAMNTSDLVNMETDVCWDSGSAMGITTDPDDMVFVDSSESAKESVMLKGPSVGKPGCVGNHKLDRDKTPQIQNRKARVS